MLINGGQRHESRLGTGAAPPLSRCLAAAAPASCVATLTELEQIDIEGRTAMARSCLWTLGGIALLLLGATLKSWL